MPLLVLIPFLALGCASLESLFGQDKTDRPTLDSAARQDRIASLEKSIEEDHDVLEALVSGQRTDSDGPLHKNKDLRAIAERLSQNEEELEALLRAEHAASLGRVETSEGRAGITDGRAENLEQMGQEAR